MPRSFTVMLLIVGLMATALLRAHHCRGVVGTHCEHSATTTAITPESSLSRVHTVLTNRAPGSVGACAHACSGHATAPVSPDAPAPHHQLPHSHPHPHLTCIDALPLTSAPVLDGTAVPLFFVAFPSESFVDVRASLPGARPLVERRGGDPPPGLRSTRLLI